MQLIPGCHTQFPRNFVTFGAFGCLISMTKDDPKPEKGKTSDSTEPEEEPEDEVDEAGEESFPASDAPSWTSTAAH